MRWTGETVRAARLGQTSAPHLLSALGHATGTVLVQARVADKSNEVSAIRELLEPLDLDGVVVSADVMHTQVDTAGWIRDQGGHYVLTSLGNQKTLRRMLKDLPWKTVPSVSSVGTGHGRRVRRTARGRPGTQVGGLPRSGSGSPGPTYQDHQGQEAR